MHHPVQESSCIRSTSTSLWCHYSGIRLLRSSFFTRGSSWSILSYMPSRPPVWMNKTLLSCHCEPLRMSASSPAKAFPEYTGSRTIPVSIAAFITTSSSSSLHHPTPVALLDSTEMATNAPLWSWGLPAHGIEYFHATMRGLDAAGIHSAIACSGLRTC